jgi:hypothetical protein
MPAGLATARLRARPRRQYGFPSRAFSVAAAGAVLALVAGCSSASSTAGSSGAAASPIPAVSSPPAGQGSASAPATPISSASGASAGELPAAITITETDNGKTFEVGRRTQVALRLTNRERWTPPAVAGTSVRLFAVAYLIDPGFSEWTVEPVETGPSTITSTGEPNCPAGSPCPSSRTEFAVTVDVR